ncbi:hypothetical protein A3H65_04430 [Candidatus Giovannonibacteria bacterium RIFCSPLOWO2_02_FULL_45_14]|uniref:Uncharacterized protein n=1 Tax=Candidatus Giovannonibacteria bacterium RIFCSPLOWO2_12_FULL_44_15 TaxID=1798364 RepID=A0A1F5XZQ2_9BACT|nr:MAG: hypothetical protein A3C75_00300 [Candidatus Giovannonibacteria bacterium RIFCSPHIGHO2_02_FULL_44_31]OGF75939.1 MAG: hypothetical protein A3E62_02815 [Candidatus Giovannonibacteria bacterium RIFCSPHIGHO2_12_FULL_44_29]OGF90658.1 MAG: hypothetical protein A3H65_04430 [Candidatus Giovannonibacteria bacterium RIFCSPLOWO2_02_FULL_45_14]OGF93398.1 MAG: hypothetical protein A3G54_01705 [Candidatus Giovannonibacteria bacterium RIFCSPLOWO2_12_FULL_44_15]
MQVALSDHKGKWKGWRTVYGMVPGTNAKHPIRILPPAVDAAEGNQEFSFETTGFGDKIYNVDKMKAYAQKLPVTLLPLRKLAHAADIDNYYWIDRDDNKLGPFQMLEDWEYAKKVSAWRDHVRGIERANLKDPIWAIERGHRLIVINGMHRLTRALLGKEWDRSCLSHDRVIKSISYAAKNWSNWNWNGGGASRKIL